MAASTAARPCWSVERTCVSPPLKREGISYAQVLEKRAPIGIDEKGVNVRNELSLGKLVAAFLLQCLSAIGANELRIS